jgi:arylsulfatase A-like enzyme
LIVLILITIAGIGIKVARTPPASSNRPNVIVIFADDLGYGDLSCYGATKVDTPNIDRLASEGRRFTDAHSASAVCTPSRYSLLTGEYAFRKEMWKPAFLQTGLLVDTQQLTLASLMKQSGYATACIGKWHLGFGEEEPNWNGELKPGPLELGFDYYFGVPVLNSHPPFVYVENHRVVGLDPADPFVVGERATTKSYPEKMQLDGIGGAKAAHALYEDEKVATTLTEKAVNWIRRQKRGPFFLYLATTNIHHPFTPHPRFKGSSEAGRYGDFVHELDWVVGQVLKTLDEQGLADNTLVIRTSDNGGMLNLGGQDAWAAGHRLNGDLLGFKFGAWEGGHRIPFLARWPGEIKAGSTSEQLICNVDMLATFASLTGVELERGQGPDSFDVLPALLVEPTQPIRDHVVLAPRGATHLAVRQGKWIYIGARGAGGFSGIKRGQHAFGGPEALAFTKQQNSDITPGGEFKKNAPPAQLYDLDADLSQTTNLYDQHPEIVAQLKLRLGQILESPTRPGSELIATEAK